MISATRTRAVTTQCRVHQSRTSIFRDADCRLLESTRLELKESSGNHEENEGLIGCQNQMLWLYAFGSSPIRSGGYYPFFWQDPRK
jgi:hypothetical protein